MDLSTNRIDLIIIVVYLVGILLIGILSVRLKRMTSEGYFLAGRGLGWVMVGAACLVTKVAAERLGVQAETELYQVGAVQFGEQEPFSDARV